MKAQHLPNETGFTIIELLIASTVFAIVLMLCTFGLLQVTRTYYKGVTSAQTQQTARSIIDQVSQAIQFSGTTPIGTQATAPGATGVFCINGTRYTYVLDRQLNDHPDSAKSQLSHVLVSDTSTDCSHPANLANFSSLVNPKELMSPNMRLASLSITKATNGNNLYAISLSVVYGDNDLLANNNTQCATTFSFGTQFCAVSTLNTTVQKRLN